MIAARLVGLALQRKWNVRERADIVWFDAPMAPGHINHPTARQTCGRIGEIADKDPTLIAAIGAKCLPPKAEPRSALLAGAQNQPLMGA